MKTTLLHRLPMIPRLKAIDEKAECLAQEYMGWELLEVDDSAEEILICKPCSPAWSYTRSKHLLILCGELAAAWQRSMAASSEGEPLAKSCAVTHPIDEGGYSISLGDIHHAQNCEHSDR